MSIVARLRSRPIVSKADALRDLGDWTAAADHYRRALELAPARTGVWIQLGHVLKERGAYGEAAEAYARALALRPRSADIHLQIGHLEKLRGNLGASAASYARALAIGGQRSEAAGELQSLGHRIDQDDSTVTRMSGSAKAQKGDVEARLEAISGQMSIFLEHVSTTKALAFELARCKAELEELRVRVSLLGTDAALGGLKLGALPLAGGAADAAASGGAAIGGERAEIQGKIGAAVVEQPVGKAVR